MPHIIVVLYTSIGNIKQMKGLEDLLWLVQAELKEKLGKMYDVRDNQSVFVFGFRTQVCSPAWPHQGLAPGSSRCQTSMHFHEPLQGADWFY